MSGDARLRVCGIAGSLREGSYNRRLLRACAEEAPEGMQIVPFERVGDLPLYNQDVEEEGLPGPVRALHAAIRGADALLIATPEYNFGVPGVLKNLIDWASRPPRDSALAGKPAAIVGATPGRMGTARAQLQLRQSFVFTRTPAVLQPEVLVASAHEKFDEDGRLTDDVARGLIRELLGNLAEWTRRLAR